MVAGNLGLLPLAGILAKGRRSNPDLHWHQHLAGPRLPAQTLWVKKRMVLNCTKISERITLAGLTGDQLFSGAYLQRRTAFLLTKHIKYAMTYRKYNSFIFCINKQ